MVRGKQKLILVVIVVVTFLCYSNSLHGEWAYDDNFAIVNNADVQPNSPLLPLLLHDFWGQDISKPDSHKSYRPLSVLSFRLNHIIHGTDTFGYHLVNVILHCFTTLMVSILANTFFEDSSITILSGLLFGLHPIHTEAVSSIVGRAEPLSASFYLVALIAFQQTLLHSSGRGKITNGILHVVYIFCYTCATLSKETGYTVIGVMILQTILLSPRNKSSKSVIIIPIFCGVVYLLVRAWLTSTFTLYNFRHLENPIAFAESRLVRILSFAYLHTRYLALLFFPLHLSADYSFNAIPLVESAFDSRNISSLVAYVGLYSSLALSAYRSYKGSEESKKILLLLMFGIFSFLPATNVFFYVGTLLAERLLYIPSIPFCILLSWLLVRTARALHKYHLPSGARISFMVLLTCFTACIVGGYTYRTYTRNADWQSEHTLFMSALEEYPGSAKVWFNVGILHRRYQDWEKALQAFSKAREIEPVYCEVDYWAGLTYLNQGNTSLAIDYLNTSIDCVYTAVQAVTTLNKIYSILQSTSPNNATLLYQWGHVLTRINRSEEAVLYYYQAAVILHNSHQYTASLQILRSALSLLAASPPSLGVLDMTCTVHLWLGAGYLKTEDLPKSVAHIREVARVDTALFTYENPMPSFAASPDLRGKDTRSGNMTCDGLKETARQTLAGLYVTYIRNGNTLDTREMLELAVLLAEQGYAETSLVKYYEASVALYNAGDLINAIRVLAHGLEVNKKQNTIPNYVKVEELYKAMQANLAQLQMSHGG